MSLIMRGALVTVLMLVGLQFTQSWINQIVMPLLVPLLLTIAMLAFLSALRLYTQLQTLTCENWKGLIFGCVLVLLITALLGSLIAIKLLFVHDTNMLFGIFNYFYYFLAFSLLFLAQIAYRIDRIGESGQLNFNFIAMYYFGLGALVAILIGIENTQWRFINHYFFYFLFYGNPLLISLLAAILFYKSRSVFSSVLMFVSLIFSSLLFFLLINKYQHPVVAVAVMCGLLVVLLMMSYRNTLQPQQQLKLTEAGVKWSKPSVMQLLLNRQSFSQLLALLLLLGFLIMLMFIPMNHYIQNQQFRNQQTILKQIKTSITQQKNLLLQELAILRKYDQINALSNCSNKSVLNVTPSTVAQPLGQVQLKVRMSKLIHQIIIEQQSQLWQVQCDIDLTQFLLAPIWIKDANEQVYTLSAGEMVKQIGLDKKAIKQQVSLDNVNFYIVSDARNWLKNIEITPQIVLILVTLLYVFYFFSCLLFSQIFNPIRYMSWVIANRIMQPNSAIMPVNIKNDLGDLAKAIEKVQKMVFQNNITLQKEVFLKTEISEQLERSKEQAEKSNHSKSEFLAMMSHEIRTPMNGVVGIAQILSKTDLNHEQQEYVETIVHSSEMLLMILNDILDISKIEARQLTLEKMTFNIKVLVIETIKLFYLEAIKKNVELIIDFDHDFNFEFFGDPLRIKQVISNFLSNALKFTKQGHVLIKVSYIEAQTIVRVDVIDTGIGIKKSKVDRLFEKFVQEDSSTTRKYGGTGLGLSICKQLIELMNGDILVSSSQLGTKFTFEIPLQKNIASIRQTHDFFKYKNIALIDFYAPCFDVYKKFFNQEGNNIISYQDMFVKDIDNLTDFVSEFFFQKNIKNHDILIIDFKKEVDLMKYFCEQYYAQKISVPLLMLINAETDSEWLWTKFNIPCLTKPISKTRMLNQIKMMFNPNSEVIMKERKAKKTGIRVDANVLIAEDTELNQFIISEILQPFGLKFEFANTGLEAVSLFENKSFDIVFMDCLMPEMDGYAATRLIREMPEGKDTPIIALTANALEEAKNKCFAAGMNDFLSKPFVEKDLISMFKKYIPKQVTDLKLGGSMQKNSDQKILIKNKLDEFEKLMGKEKIIILVQRTLEESQKYIALLKDSDSLVDKRRAVHSLKSTSANYNYMVMADFAQEFEKQLVEENTVNLAENTQQLEEFCSQLCLYLKEISE